MTYEQYDTDVDKLDEVLEALVDKAEEAAIGIGDDIECAVIAGWYGEASMRLRRLRRAVPALVLERRIVVKGWKMDGGKRREFVDYHLYHISSLAFERKRIGEDVKDWQPHITEVTVEQRYTTPWTVSDAT